jgi:hypothetical protein
MDIVLHLVHRTDEAAAELAGESRGQVCFVHGEEKCIPIGVAALVLLSTGRDNAGVLAVEKDRSARF